MFPLNKQMGGGPSKEQSATTRQQAETVADYYNRLGQNFHVYDHGHKFATADEALNYTDEVTELYGKAKDLTLTGAEGQRKDDLLGHYSRWGMKAPDWLAHGGAFRTAEEKSAYLSKLNALFEKELGNSGVDSRTMVDKDRDLLNRAKEYVDDFDDLRLDGDGRFLSSDQAAQFKDKLKTAYDSNVPHYSEYGYTNVGKSKENENFGLNTQNIKTVRDVGLNSNAVVPNAPTFVE